MNRDEVLERLRSARAVFDAKVAAIPPDCLESPIPGHTHTVAEILSHVASYDELIVERLRAARRGEATAFDRDRVGWEQFNERVWAEAAEKSGGEAVDHARAVFSQLLEEVGRLEDVELNERAGITEYLDPAWLDDRALWELIAIDGYDHYPMHLPHLDAACGKG